MRSKKTTIKSCPSFNSSSILDSNLSDSTGHSSWLTHQLLAYYKLKSSKLEKEYDELLQIIEEIKSSCILADALQQELNSRNEEVSKLQQLVGDLQIYLFREREENLRLTAENDQLKIQDYENKKKINILMTINGTTERKYCHFITSDIQGNLVASKLPPKLQKLKAEKHKQITKSIETDKKDTNELDDPQITILNNQLLASQLDHHIKISREQIEVLLKEKDLLTQEREIERKRLQKQIDLLSLKLKESQKLLCDTAEKLVKSQQIYEKDKTTWMEEKDKCHRTIQTLKRRLGDDVGDILCSDRSSKTRYYEDSKAIKDKTIEKKLADAYQQQIIALETEVNTLRERANTCRKIFKEKTEKMTAQVAYLKNKYEDLDRRRLLEAEGFRTDIRMLRERLKELDKKLAKASIGIQTNEQEQLLVSAKNTLNRAKQLEKELAHMKTKIYALESNPEYFES